VGRCLVRRFWWGRGDVHLNIFERLWKEIKGSWLKPSDYQRADSLPYVADRICAVIRKRIVFKIVFTFSILSYTNSKT
jgi:transposase